MARFNSIQFNFKYDCVNSPFNIDITQISEAAFEHLAFILENELDWPELSAITGNSLLFLINKIKICK